MRLAIVSDEISRDFSTAVELGVEWGIRTFEIRGLRTGRIPEVAEWEIRDLSAVNEQFGITISALSPGVFKVPIAAAETAHQLRETLPKSYELAHRLGTDRVIIFGGRREEGVEQKAALPRVVDLLRQAVEEAERAGIRLLLENEPICWADTGQAAAEIIRQVSHPHLRLNWDPGNSFHAGGRPYPDEYEGLKDLVGHLHINDKRRREGRCETVALGEGEVDWRGQLAALRRDGFDGYYTVETHYGPRVMASRVCWENLRRMLLEIY